MALHYRIIPVTPFAQNCTLLWCDKTMQAAVVDPGGDLDEILREEKNCNVEISQIFLTHGHLDHIGAAGILAKERNIPIIGPQEEDRFWFDSISDQVQMFGFPKIANFLPDKWLTDGEEVKIGNETLQTLHCPGHTPGHIVFFHTSSQLAIVGDVLFRGSIGRTDFPRGDHAALISSIKQKLLPLGDDVTFISGHGPKSTLGYEATHNPYLLRG